MTTIIASIIGAILQIANEVLKRTSPESKAKKRVEDAKAKWDAFYKSQMDSFRKRNNNS